MAQSFVVLPPALTRRTSGVFSLISWVLKSLEKGSKRVSSHLYKIKCGDNRSDTQHNRERGRASTLKREVNHKLN